VHKFGGQKHKDEMTAGWWLATVISFLSWIDVDDRVTGLNLVKR